MCRILGQSRSSQRYTSRKIDDSEIRLSVIRLALQYGGYGYRKVEGLLRAEGVIINHKRVERIWREEGLKVPKRQKKRKRLHTNQNSCVLQKALYPNHIWSYDFVADKLSNGRKYRILTVIDEYTRECLTCEARLAIGSYEVVEVLTKLVKLHGKPESIRSDNGPEFTSKYITTFLSDIDVKMLLIYPGSPWENGFNERFNGSLRAELLNLESFDSIVEAQIVINKFVQTYNNIRPHASLNYQTPIQFKQAITQN